MQKYLHKCNNAFQLYLLLFSKFFYTVDGNWGQWGQWSTCTGNGGTHERTKECKDPPSKNEWTTCYGDDIQIITCNPESCPIDGNWGAFNSWNQCSVSCVGGTQSSTRQCHNPPALFGGQQYAGVDTRTQNCPSIQGVPEKRMMPFCLGLWNYTEAVLLNSFIEKYIQGVLKVYSLATLVTLGFL